MNSVQIHVGDCLDALREMPDGSIDSIVTDPPYGLSFMGRRWDYDVPSVEIWEECLRVLKPGGHLLAFAGTRTQHRMAVRIEDAGFEIRDMIAWVYGSGFPKSMDVSKAIDKARRRDFVQAAIDIGVPLPGRSVDDWTKEGHAPGDTWWKEFTAALPQETWEAIERKVIGQCVSGESAWFASGAGDITAPATDAARQWEGWGTALKPALEPITVARKPLSTCATNVLQMVESQLRERGVRGEILWKPENASGAARSKKTISSGSIRPSERSATSAKTADESVTPSAEQQSLKSSEQLGTSGLKQTQGASESFQGCTTSGCGNPSSAPTEGSARAAESVSATSSPSTTSTAAEPSTASKFTGRCTPNCAETVSRPDTESFAGIATGLTGSMETVRISRDSEGFFLWPKGLPEFVPGSPLTVAANVLAHGTGALNIDGCRIETSDNQSRPRGSFPHSDDSWGNGRPNEVSESHTAGRFPANLIHDGSDEVVAGFPRSKSCSTPSAAKPEGAILRGARSQGAIYPGEDGSAARFFYCAKASKKDRGEGNAHPTVKPTELMRYLLRLVTPPGGVVLDPFMGSGSTGKAAMLEGFRFIGCELSPEYAEIAKRRIAATQAQPGRPKQETTDLFAA